MVYPVGDYVRTLRSLKGLSQLGLAQRAGLSEGALFELEFGSSLPGEQDLRTALDALEATPRELKQALLLLRLQGAKQPVQHGETSHGILLPDVGSSAGLGDLLHALRRRKDWTQDQVATLTGVTRRTVHGWETGQELPSEEALERTCIALGASAEEARGLRLWRTVPPAWKPVWTIGEFEAEIARFRLQIFQDPLMDLSARTLKHRLPAVAGDAEAMLRMSALLESEHAAGLTLRERTNEARACVQRALHLFNAMGKPEQFWVGALNLASGYAVKSSNSNVAGAKILEKWLPLMASASRRMYLLCDMALYTALDGRQTEATSLLNEAESALRSADPESESYFRLTRARVRLKTERSVELLDWLMEVETQPVRRVAHLLMWTASLLAAGEREAASRYLARAGSELTADAPRLLQRKFSLLADCF